MSASAHLMGLGGVIAAIVLSPLPAETPTSSVEIDGRWSVRHPDAGDVAPVEMASADSDPRWKPVVASGRSQERLPDPTASELSRFVQQQIDRSVAQGQHRTAEENEDKLSSLGRRLSETSNRTSVDQMADFLSGLGSKREDSSEVKGEGRAFDVDTAQIDRVRKETDSGGATHYIATLIDASGVTREIELDAETGAQLYRTMKIIESNPLLERVYRRIVMGFLDQMLRRETRE